MKEYMYVQKMDQRKIFKILSYFYLSWYFEWSIELEIKFYLQTTNQWKEIKKKYIKKVSMQFPSFNNNKKSKLVFNRNAAQGWFWWQFQSVFSK